MRWGGADRKRCHGNTQAAFHARARTRRAPPGCVRRAYQPHPGRLLPGPRRERTANEPATRGGPRSCRRPRLDMLGSRLRGLALYVRDFPRAVTRAWRAGAPRERIWGGCRTDGLGSLEVRPYRNLEPLGLIIGGVSSAEADETHNLLKPERQ